MLCQQVICSTADLQRKLEKLFHGLSFAGDAEDNMVNIKSGWQIKIQTNTQLAKVCPVFFFLFYFFGGCTYGSDHKSLQLVKPCTLNVIGRVVDSSGRGNNWRQPRVGGERQTISRGNK